MGDIIVWKTAEEVMKMAGEMSKLVVGMTPEEAAATLEFTETASGMFVKTVVDTAAVAGEAATAGEAIAGAAATGGAATTAANLTLYTTAEGTTAVGGLGSIALPIAACALAGAGGYTLGNIISDEIDKKYPDFFNGMFESVSKFLTGDEKTLAFIFDKDGNTYMPEESKIAISDYLNNAISMKSESVESANLQISFKPLYVGQRIMVSTSGSRVYSTRVSKITLTSPVYCFVTNGESSYGTNYLYLTSKEPFTFETETFEYNNGELILSSNGRYTEPAPETYLGRTSYTNITSAGNEAGYTNYPFLVDLIPNKVPSNFSSDYVSDIINEILFGDHLSDSSMPNIKKEELPEKPKIEVPSTYPTWLPIPMPVTAPNKMPNEFPSFAPENDPSRVTPYLPQPQPYPEKVPLPTPSPDPNPNPIIVPVPNYIPVPQPTPSPDLDPSAEPVPNPNPAPKPTPTPKPDDTGKTPTPILPVVPPISSEADGLLHVYNPTSAQINEFGRWLWTTFSGDLIDTIAKLFNNPMDAVIGLHELYCTPSTGSTTTIKAGFLDSGVTSRLVDSRYTEINCGAITVPEYWGNYLDYSPYTKVYCYLPFIGIVELNTDDIVGHGVQITYKIDSYNGSCVAMITTAKKQDEESVVYQFSGNCSVEVPITSGMKSAMQSALIGAATCAVGAMGAGLAAAAITDAAFVGGAKRGLNSKNTVAHSGTFGSSYGAMGIKKPYIIVKRPVQKVVHGYNKNYGYPAHSMVTIGNCSGYLRCRDFEVVSSTATEEEKKRIEVLLKEGVYV